MQDVLIIGGGLSGLICAQQLAAAGLSVGLIERNEYPFHRVCGEYVSNETLPFLTSIGFDPFAFGAVKISRFGLSAPRGTSLELALGQGAFGISRFTFDYALYELANTAGARFWLNEKAIGVERKVDHFEVETARSGVLKAKTVIGAQGKRSNLDAFLNRKFFRSRSPWVGVKYHLKIEHPEDLIELHNFKDGYCGISRVEEERVCVCYLTSRANLKRYGNIPAMEEAVLKQNPRLKTILESGINLYDRPKVINEISFAKKPLVEEGILMTGDSGGMIAPLCGNGMAMAIHSAKILSENVLPFFAGTIDRKTLEQAYQSTWKKQFSKRLWVGRNVQRLFGNPLVTEGFVRCFKQLPRLANWVVKQTHGEPF